MSDLCKRAKIVAVCGLDGSGKTTLWRSLRESGEIPNSVFVTRNNRRDWNNLFDLHCDRYNVSTMSSVSAQWLRWAHAFDMLHYYKTQVEPLLQQDVIIISDRWTYCSIAFAMGMEPQRESIAEMLSVIPEADLILFLSVEPQESRRRILLRGAAQVDETIEELELLEKGYMVTLPSQRTQMLYRLTADDAFALALRSVNELVGLPNNEI